MNLYDLHTSPWAIHPEKLKGIINIYNNYLKGPKLDLSDMEAKLNPKGSAPEPAPYQVMNGNAIINITGILIKNVSAFMRLFYGANGITEITENIQTALEDPEVKRIILYIDSPGGTVDGTQELANFIFNSRGRKEIVAYSDGMIASAAYWIASATDKIFISGDTTELGSIGVITTHVDYTKMNEDYGIKVTHIYAGKYKAAGSPDKSLSKDDKEYIQGQIDYLYSIFVRDVARNRSASVEEVLQNMADAKIFIGTQAVDAGLADGVSDMGQLTGGVPESNTFVLNSGADKAAEKNYEKEDNTVEMTVEILQQNHPQVFESVKKLGAAEAVKENGEAVNKAAEEAAKKETERVKSVKAQSLPGHEALIEKLMFDGKTTGPEAAEQVLQAEKAAKEAALKKFRAEGKDLEVQDTEPEETETDATDERPVEQQAKENWDKDSKLRAEFGDDFAAYLAWMKESKAGNARILGQKNGGK